MALNNYRLIRNMDRVVTWKEIGSYDRLLEISREKKGWRVAIVDNGKLKRLKGGIKTKSAALAYAKSHMRKH